MMSYASLHRRLALIGLCSTFLGCAFAKTVPSVFIMGTCQAIFTSLFQLMVDALLVDRARRDLHQAAAFQSVANSSKWMGTFVAQVCALVTYARGLGGAMFVNGALLTARQAIAVTSVAPLLVLVMAFRVPETADLQSSGHCCCSPMNVVHMNCNSVRFACCVALVQVNLVLVGCRSFFSEVATWWLIFVVSLTLTILLALLVLVVPWKCTAAFTERNPSIDLAPGTAHTVARPLSCERSSWRWIRIALFCFIANTIPTSGVSVSLLQFNILAEDSYQTLGIVSSCASVFAALAFGGCFKQWSPHRAIAASALLSMISALSRLPFVYIAIDYMGGHKLKSANMFSMLGSLAVSASILDSISTIFVVLPIDTLVTIASGVEKQNKSSTLLAVFLSVYSFGSTIGGLVSASLLDTIGLNGENWESLPLWITCTACAKLLILICLPIVPFLAIADTTGNEPDESTAGMHGTTSLQCSTNETLMGT